MKTESDCIMVEEIKTNVEDHDQAEWILEQIQSTFKNYTANFDLEDCDRILVVKCTTGEVRPMLVIDLLSSHNYYAEVYPIINQVMIKII